MSLTSDDISRLGELARIRLDDAERAHMLAQLDDIFGIIEKLRADVVTESDHRAENQRSAPSVADGLYLVPRVVE